MPTNQQNSSYNRPNKGSGHAKKTRWRAAIPATQVCLITRFTLRVLRNRTNRQPTKGISVEPKKTPRCSSAALAWSTTEVAMLSKQGGEQRFRASLLSYNLVDAACSRIRTNRQPTKGISNEPKQKYSTLLICSAGLVAQITCFLHFCFANQRNNYWRTANQQNGETQIHQENTLRHCRETAPSQKFPYDSQI